MTDDFDLRYFECQVAPQNPGGSQQLLKMTETGHLAGYYDIGRTEVDPMPADPDFKATGIWWRATAYPTLASADDRGSGGIRYRYWDAALCLLSAELPSPACGRGNGVCAWGEGS